MSDARQLLEGLDSDQRRIAETLRGPLVVLAGAGTGKTRAITHRIAYGVSTGVYDAQRVLAVTFTRKAAAEMQARLRGLGAGGVRAHTFHGAALAQLGHFWPLVVGGQAPQVLGGKVQTIAQAADAIQLRLSPEDLRDVAAEIEWRKVSMLSLEDYARLIEGAGGQRSIPAGISGQQLVTLHEEYAKLLEKRRQIDFEDVLILMTGMLEAEPRVAMQVRERYRFFTVDEYQDVSPLQHALLRMWLGERQDLCVVGDASQTIYSFAGASSDYLLRFATEFQGAQEIRLERNYRSVEPIVVAANRLMKGRPGALTLQAARESRAPAKRARRTARQQNTHDVGEQMTVSFEWFANEHEEAAAVASSIAAAITQGTPAAEIAVLYRTNAQSAAIESELQARGVSCRVHGALRFFERNEVKQALMLIRGQAKAADDRPLFQIVTHMLREVGWSPEPPEGAAAREKWQALDAILTLVDEQPPHVGIAEFSEELLARSQTHHEPTLDSVTLSAVHAAKGLEWSLVHVIGLSEGLMPIGYALTDEAIDEERRLAYVALTRARDILRLSGAGGHTRAARMPSRFIAEAGLRAVQL